MAERYFVTHAPGCGCVDRTPYPAATAYDVALYLWGRPVTRHTVYDGECPYHFSMGDIQVILVTLVWYEAPYVRRVLPVTIPLQALRNLGLYRGHGEPGDTVVCIIGGDTPQEDPYGPDIC